MDIDKLKCDERLYEYNPCGYCGVFMPKHVMEEIAKKATKFQNDVREILTKNKNDLYQQDWGLVYPNGEQTSVYFACKDDVDRRIKLFKPNTPTLRDTVYLAEPLSKERAFIIDSLGGTKP